MDTVLIASISVGVILLAHVFVFILKYRTVGPDEALIVTGSYLERKCS